MDIPIMVIAAVCATIIVVGFAVRTYNKIKSKAVADAQKKA